MIPEIPRLQEAVNLEKSLSLMNTLLLPEVPSPTGSATWLLPPALAKGAWDILTHLPALPATPALSKATGLGLLPREVEWVSQGQAGGQLTLPQPQGGGDQHLGRETDSASGLAQTGCTSFLPAQNTFSIKVKAARAGGFDHKASLCKALGELSPFQRRKARFGEEQMERTQDRDGTGGHALPPVSSPGSVAAGRSLHL